MTMNPYGFNAKMTPIARPPMTPPYYRDKFILGISGDYYTNFIVFMLKPEWKHPDPSINLKLSNGKGNCFVRINDPDELIKLADWLVAVASTVKQKVEELKPESELLKEQQRTYFSKLQEMKQIQQFIQGEGDQPNE